MINLSWEEKELVLKGDGSILVVRNKRNVFLMLLYFTFSANSFRRVEGLPGSK